MSLPEGGLASQGVDGTFLYPDNLPHTATFDYEMGGSAIGSGLAGLQVQVWTCFYEAGSVKVRVLDDPNPATTLFTLGGISEISFTFDRAMRPAVVYTVGVLGYLYWYDTTINNYVTTSLGIIRSPRATHDDKRFRSDQLSDVIIAYLRDDFLCYRQQRDRYLIEYTLATGIPLDMVLKQVGMTDKNRLQFKIELP